MSLAASGEITIQRVLERNREAAAVSSGKLQALSPLLTLSRGICYRCGFPEKTLVRDGRGLAPGDRLDITFQRGGARLHGGIDPRPVGKKIFKISLRTMLLVCIMTVYHMQGKEVPMAVEKFETCTEKTGRGGEKARRRGTFP